MYMYIYICVFVYVCVYRSLYLHVSQMGASFLGESVAEYREVPLHCRCMSSPVPTRTYCPASPFPYPTRDLDISSDAAKNSSELSQAAF